MSQEGVRLVRRGFSAFEDGDLSQMLDLLADDLITFRADPDGATYHGKDGFLESTADWTEGFRQWSVIPDEFIDAGDHVVARVRQSALGDESGAAVEGEFWWVFEIRGTTISKVSFYAREDQALEAAGLLE